MLHDSVEPGAPMATDPATIDFLLDQLGARAARYSSRRMFGEYCLYRDGLPVALVCDDVLFVKDTDDGRAAMAASMPVEFGPPYPGAKPHLRITPDRWDDGDWLAGVLDRTAAALPPPKPRARKAGASASAARPRARVTPNASKKTPEAGAKPRRPKPG